MAAALAHELNQPLTALSVYGSACQQMLEQGGNEERLRDTIGRMVTESYRAADVVRRLRDFFRTGATRLERIALRNLMDSVSLQFSEKASTQGIELVFSPAPDCILLVDRLQLEVILRNLIANAFDAVLERPAGQRRVSITAELAETDMVRIRVEDSGPGLSSEKVTRLFEAFQSSKSSGLGLGLAISRAIAQAHGGDLAAVAAEGGMFVLTLPIEEHAHDAS